MWKKIFIMATNIFILLITSIDFTYIIISPTHPPHQVKNIELSTILKTLIPNEFLKKTSFPVKFLTTFYFVEARNQPTKIVVIYFLIFDDNHLTNSYYSSTDSKISSLLDT